MASPALTALYNFIAGRKDDRIGFVVFPGEPLTLVPPTLDYGLLMRSVKDVQVVLRPRDLWVGVSQ